MQDWQTLSTFHELTDGQAPALPRVQVPQKRPLLDACHVGVVLRAVLLVEVVAAVGAMYVSDGWREWFNRTSLLTAAALPAVLLWLLVACSLKHVLARLAETAQVLVGVGMGALAGLAACGMLQLFAGGLLAGLIWRARGALPAETSARLAELQSRIRPHFLFNTLNSAIALVRAEPAKAEAMLEDLSDLFRHALQEHGGSTTLEAEIELARRYLAIEQVRFGERLSVDWRVDPTAGQARLPPLLLQPLVENAVRHGVEPSSRGAQLLVSTERRGSSVVVKVSNTVPQGQGEAGHGLALANAKARLGLLHDVEGRFQHGLKDGVYQVRIEVPAP
jgi:two-component system, LytTR family, sensor histidine kinase AlgZ